MRDLKYKLSIGFWILLVCITVGYLAYRYLYHWNAEKRFTIATLKSEYVTSKDVGKLFVYSINGVEYESICTTSKCATSPIGARYIVEFAVENPTWNHIHFDLQVIDESLMPPDTGWYNIPKLDKQ